MEDFLHFLGIALVILSIGGCICIGDIGEARRIEAIANAKLIENSIDNK